MRGFFALMAPMPIKSHASPSSALCDAAKVLNSIVTVFSFFAGWSAIKGLLSHDSDRIKVFGLYYVLASVSLLGVTLAHTYEICFYEQMKDCGTARWVTLMLPFHLPQVFVFAYFAHIIFSLHAKMQDGDASMDALSSVLEGMHGGPLSSMRGRLARAAARLSADMPMEEAQLPLATTSSAFEGEGRSLASEPSVARPPPQAFQGTPFTLE
jgi:hypothetical protein